MCHPHPAIAPTPTATGFDHSPKNTPTTAPILIAPPITAPTPIIPTSSLTHTPPLAGNDCPSHNSSSMDTQHENWGFVNEEYKAYDMLTHVVKENVGANANIEDEGGVEGQGEIMEDGGKLKDKGMKIGRMRGDNKRKMVCRWMRMRGELKNNTRVEFNNMRDTT